MKKFLLLFFAAAAFSCFNTVAQAQEDNGDQREPLFAAQSNNPSQNTLQVFNSRAQLVASLPTGGKGGVGGNGGSVQVRDRVIVLAEFGSKDVAVFVRNDEGFSQKQSVRTASAPVSVAFGGPNKNHLFVLETDRAESYIAYEDGSFSLDGSASLAIADGSAGQIDYLTDGSVIYTEKSGTVATIATNSSGAIVGSSISVKNLPALMVPLGLKTRGKLTILTNAHAGATSFQQLLISNGSVISESNGTGVFPNDADCWAGCLLGTPFCYLADSPGHKLDRVVATDTNIWFDKVAATFPGGPTDLAVSGKLIGVIFGGGVAIYKADSEGELQNLGTASAGPLNGAAWIN